MKDDLRERERYKNLNMGLVSYTLINNACAAAVCVDVNMNLS